MYQLGSLVSLNTPTDLDQEGMCYHLHPSMCEAPIEFGRQVSPLQHFKLLGVGLTPGKG